LIWVIAPDTAIFYTSGGALAGGNVKIHGN
jgi:hypothetical protein